MNDIPTTTLALGSRPVVRVLIVTRAVQPVLDAAQNVHDIITAAHYPVLVAAPPNWRQAVDDFAPEVVLVELGDDLAAVRELCASLKTEPPGGRVAAVGVLPGGREPGAGPSWPTLRACGIDDVLGAGATPQEVLGHIELLAHLTQLWRDLAATREQLARQLRLDDLTQLLNRRFFFQAAHHEGARARRYNHPLACLMLDIDYLRLYNSAFGYNCGDYVLRTVANLLRQWTRDSDVVARFGEEKFVILLPETHVDGAVQLREKLLGVVADTPFVWDGHPLPVTISIGESERRLAVGPTDLREDDEGETISVREEIADMLADADAALSVAKKGARYPDFGLTAPNRATSALTGLLGVA